MKLSKIFHTEQQEGYKYEIIKVKSRTFYKPIQIEKEKDVLDTSKSEEIDLDSLKVNLDAKDLVKMMSKKASNFIPVGKLNGPVKRKTEVPIKRKRYSDQFKDSLFIKKDTYRKLKMLENFINDNKDINLMIENYKECITMSMDLLNSEFSIPHKIMFKAFDLTRYGFKYEDFGCESTEEEEEEKKDKDYEND